MGFVIIWIVCGLIAGAIYSGKGRSGLTGFLAGVVLGPIGILLALASSKSESGLVARGDMKKCPHCAELVRSDAKACRYCGRDI